MTKKEFAWLLIRIAGVWFLWQSLTVAVTIVTSFIHWSKDGVGLSISPAGFSQFALHMIVSLALGVYCTLGGSVLFYILDREG